MWEQCTTGWCTGAVMPCVWGRFRQGCGPGGGGSVFVRIGGEGRTLSREGGRFEEVLEPFEVKPCFLQPE